MTQTPKDVAARRAKRRRAAKIRRLKFLISIFLVLAVIVTVILSLTVFFSVEKIVVTGSKKYDDRAVIEASGLMGENIILASEEELEEQLRSKLPYIDEISLDKKLSGTVTIKITDAKEYAAFLISDKYYVVSKHGYVLRITDSLPEKTMEIITDVKAAECGEKLGFSDKEKKKFLSRIIAILEKYDIKINNLNLKNVTSLTARVEDGFNVNFGNEVNIDRKCAQLATMLKSIGSDARGSINLSMWTNATPDGTFIRENTAVITENLLKYLKENDITVDNIDAGDENNIKVQIEGKFDVLLGDSQHLEEKCNYLASLIDGLTDKSSIDLSKWTPDNQQADFKKLP